MGEVGATPVYERPPSLLLVEDEEGEARLIQRLLSEALDPPPQVRHVTRLGDAITALRGDTAFDIVLLDISLPDSSDLDTLVSILPHAGHTAIVALTGQHNEQLGVEAIRLGAQDYLFKDQLDAACFRCFGKQLRHAMERGRLQAELRASLTKLEESEANVRRVIDANADGIVIVDPDGMIVFANTAAEEIFQRPHAHLYGQAFGYPLTGGATTEIDFLRPDRSVITAEMRVVETTWQGERAFLASLRDVTERTHYEQRIERQRRRLDAINMVISEALTCETEAEVARTCLSAAEGLTKCRFGLVAELNSAGRLDGLAVSGPGWKACSLDPAVAVTHLQDLQPTGLLGYALRHDRACVVNNPAEHPQACGTPAGHPPLQSLLCIPLRHANRTTGVILLANKDGGYDDADKEDGESLGVAFVQALTRKRTENTKAALHRQLAQASIEMKNRNADLERANREIESLLYSASHDLRTPLINFSGGTLRLRRTLDDVRAQLRSVRSGDEADVASVLALLEEDAEDALRLLERGITKSEQLIEGLLQLSRSGREELTSAPIDMQQLVVDVIAVNDHIIREQCAHVRIQPLPPALGDANAVNRIVSNLVENALKYKHPERLAVIEIASIEAEGNFHRYFVRDNGLGIDARAREKIFRVFHRLRKSNVSGDGIGLAIVKKLVERHGGDIGVDSTPDVGSTFWFTLPAVATQRADSPPLSADLAVAPSAPLR